MVLAMPADEVCNRGLPDRPGCLCQDPCSQERVGRGDIELVLHAQEQPIVQDEDKPFVFCYSRLPQSRFEFLDKVLDSMCPPSCPEDQSQEIGRRGNDGGDNEGNNEIGQSCSRGQQDFDNDYSGRIEGSGPDGRDEDLSTDFCVPIALPVHSSPQCTSGLETCVLISRGKSL